MIPESPINRGCTKINAMHGFQKFDATKSRVCMIFALKQGSKSCIASDILQKTMHSLDFVTPAAVWVSDCSGKQ